MKAGRLIGPILLVFSMLLPSGCGPDVGPRDEVAVFETTYGKIVFDFLPDIAPHHVANFKRLVREGFYDGTKFYRILRDQQNGGAIGVQGGDPNTVSGDPSTWGHPRPGQEKIKAEFSNTYKHDRGTVTAARAEGDPNSDPSQFVICVVRDSSLDGKHSAFARVIEGMNVVDTMTHAPVYKRTERPVDPVVVQRSYLTSRQEALRSGEQAGQ
jgi:cyclophilin family peptidyl-prolyl cis-trans isomerase